jgi:hypothetical protein
MDRSRVFPWILRAAWAVLPFATGPAFAAALDDRSASVRTVGSALLWGAWAVVLCATLVRHPISLTLLRVTAPATLVAALWTLTPADGATTSALVAVVAALVAVALAYLPETGVLFVNGPAYPNERRYPLRVPGPLLFGPLFIAWAIAVGVPVAAALLLASRQWVAGGVVALAALGADVLLGRALHGLSRRWVVFVPAGLVLHDPMTMPDPVLFRRQIVSSVDLARAGTDALDLTQRSPGLAIEIELSEDTQLHLTKPVSRDSSTVTTRRLLFTPTRPGRVLAEARERRL